MSAAAAAVKVILCSLQSVTDTASENEVRQSFANPTVADAVANDPNTAQRDAMVNLLDTDQPLTSVQLAALKAYLKQLAGM